MSELTENRQVCPPSAVAVGSVLDISDASMLNYLEWKDRVEMGRNQNITDFLVLASDGTTCWGVTLRMAIKSAMAHDFQSPNTKVTDAAP